MRIHFLLPCVFTLAVLASCRKEAAVLPAPTTPSAPAGVVKPGFTTAAAPGATLDGVVSEENFFTTYIIPAGQNFCTGNVYAVDSFWGVSFQAIFDSSCIYTTADPANQADINKLYGFSDASSHHHQNSARFGWNWQDGALRIYAYCYMAGVRLSNEICTVSLNEPHTFRIENLPGQYLFSVDNKYFAHMERGAQEPYAHGYSLLPYFGGDEPAPHEVRIKIKELSRR